MLVVPALLMYPSMLHYAQRAKDRLIETQFAAEAANHPQELQARLAQSLTQIDAVPSLPELVASIDTSATIPQTDTAFLLSGPKVKLTNHDRSLPSKSLVFLGFRPLWWLGHRSRGRVVTSATFRQDHEEGALS